MIKNLKLLILRHIEIKIKLTIKLVNLVLIKSLKVKI